MNVADITRRFAGERPDHVALKWAGGQAPGQCTWRELDERTSRIAQALRASGVVEGERVAFLDKNGPELLEVFYGAAKIGAVATPVNFRLAPAELREIVRDAQARLWIVHAEYAAVAAEVVEQLDTPVEVIVIGGAQGSYLEWLGAHPAEDPHVPVTAGDVGLQLYTSGTSGRPKGVELTWANLAASLSDFYEDVMGLDADAVNLIVLPMFHIGGGGWAVASHTVGATTIILRNPVPAVILDVMERERVTHTTLAPALMKMIYDLPDVERRDIGALQAIFYGGSPIDDALLEGMLRTFGCGFYQAYGITETTGTCTILPPADHDPHGPHRHRLRSCGRPRAHLQVRVVDPATRVDVPDGRVGEFWLKGPTIMKGYWKQIELTSEAVVDGWYRTGDAGYRDADGYLYLQDRIKDMIVSGAENIYPAEIENALASHPAVAESAVIGVPSERWGETPKALVVLRAATSATGAELIEHCRGRLARYKCPTSVDFVEDLPRNPSGKVLKHVLRAAFWEGRGRGIS